MMKTATSLPFLSLLFAAISSVQVMAEDPQLHAAWSFDAIHGEPATVLDGASGVNDPLTGNFKLMPGVNGKALRLDGHTTVLSRPAEKAPVIGKAFTIESWVALAAYPWDNCPILSQAKPGDNLGYRLMVGTRGQVILEVGAGGRWHSLASEDWQVPLREWIHVAGSYDSKNGMVIHVDGKAVARADTAGQVDAASDVELRIGSLHQPAKPAHIHREWGTLPTWWTLDGQLDELKLHPRALSSAELSASFQSAAKDVKPVMSDRQLPSGPDGPGRFGAYYTKLAFYEQWDDLWRVDDEADVIVRFDRSPVRMVFWRGTRYSPAWVSENKLWMADQSVEAWDHGKTGNEGCYEHMQDRHCRYSHVRIIESNPARAVVHWRYAPVSANNSLWNVDPLTGKGCWIDEYYTVYPDGMAVRKPTWKTGTLGFPRQFQESLPFTQVGQTFYDVVNNPYCHVANLDGEIETCEFVKSSADRKKKRWSEDLILQRYNFKSANKPFIIFQTGNHMNCRQEGDYIPGVSRGCNHWPVGQAACDGRAIQAADRPGHMMGFPISYPPVQESDGRSWWAGLYGMGEQPVEELIRIAKAFNFPPDATVRGEGFSSEGFDAGQRAWVVANGGEPGRSLEIRLAADAGHPLHNPAIVVKGAGAGKVRITLNGQAAKPGTDCRIGWCHHVDGSDLVLWIDRQTDQPLDILIDPVAL